MHMLLSTFTYLSMLHGAFGLFEFPVAQISYNTAKYTDSSFY